MKENKLYCTFRKNQTALGSYAMGCTLAMTLCRMCHVTEKQNDIFEIGIPRQSQTWSTRVPPGRNSYPGSPPGVPG
eukprot:2730112-Rhodomonas_salina.3